MSEDVTLHYIDNLCRTLVDSGKSVNRAMLVTVSLSVLQIMLSVGVVTADQRVSIAGLELQFSFLLIVLASSWLVALAYLYLLGLARHESEVRDTIIMLYRGIKFTDESLTDREINPLEHPNFVTVIAAGRRLGSSRIGKAFRFLSIVFVLWVFFILPIVSEAVAAYTLMASYGPTWWLIVTYVVIVFLMLSYGWLYLQAYQSD